MVNIIVAIDPNNGIGLQGDMLYHDKEDLKLFRGLTMSSNVLMGRITYESIKGPLKGRKELVLSSNPKNSYYKSPTMWLNSLDPIEDLIKSKETIWAAGGAKIYKLIWGTYRDYINYIYISKFREVKEADTFFPISREELEDEFILEHTEEYTNFDLEIWKRA